MIPYIGQILLFAFGFAPAGWLICDGRLLSKEEYSELFELMGTTFGGDAATGMFALPDLRGRVPLCVGPIHPRGQIGGTETVQLTAGQIPVHVHQILAAKTTGNPTNVPGTGVQFGVASSSVGLYARTPGPTQSQLAPSTVGTMGGSVPHNNMMPTLVANYCIAVEGMLPTQPGAGLEISR